MILTALYCFCGLLTFGCWYWSSSEDERELAGLAFCISLGAWMAIWLAVVGAHMVAMVKGRERV